MPTESETEDAVGEPESRPSIKNDERRTLSWIDFLKVVALPVVTLILGFMFNSSLDARHTEDSNVRLYAEMMGRREQADSDLRKDMFKSILDTFMSKNPKLNRERELKQQVLNLELLAYNFHESLDIGPLFKDVRSRLSDTENGPDAELRKRLEKVAQEVIERQLTALSDGGMVERGDANPKLVDQLHAYVYFRAHAVDDPDFKKGEGVSHLCLSTDWTSNKRREQSFRQFTLEILAVDLETREIHVRLGVSELLGADECTRPDLDYKIEIDSDFWVGLFDFPMIDNTRISNGERCAVSLLALTPDYLDVAMAYFPGSRASLKDKPYYDEVVGKLLQRAPTVEPSVHRPQAGVQ